MVKRSIIVLILIIGLVCTNAVAQEDVSFKSTQKWQDRELTLSGKLWKPAGDGPFPAIVMLHGCIYRGITLKYYVAWAERFTDWGYVSLLVESFQPRGTENVCNRPKFISPTMRAQDAYNGKSYLQSLTFVDTKKVSVIGWSHGGIAVLRAAASSPEGATFNAAIAFYPYCPEQLTDQNAPLLILIGEKDSWHPAERCSKLTFTRTDNKHEVVLKVYPDATHSFDFEGGFRKYLSHRLQYNPEATADAIIQVKDFLAKHAK